MMKNSSFNQIKLKQLDTYLNTCIENEVFPGVSFSIVTRNDSYRIVKGYRSLIPEKILNDDNTLYDLASLSKVVCTTFCILKLIENGKFTLKTKVSDILDDFSNKNITILNCLNHTSGLISDLGDYKKLNKLELIDLIIHIDPIYKINTKVEYSDLNFIILGLIVEKISGLNLKEYSDKNLFNKLDMIDSGYLLTKDISLYASYENKPDRGIVRGSVHDGKAYILDGIAGHAGVFSTIGDLEIYTKMLLNNGLYKGDRLLEPESIELLKKCSTENLNEKRSVGWVISDKNYSLGDYYSSTTLFHTGFTGGSILIDFEKGVSMITMCNRIHPSRNNKDILSLRNNIHNLGYQCIKKEK